MKIKIIKVFPCLLFSFSLFGAEKCHLGSKYIEGFKKCNSEMHSMVGANPRGLSKLESFGICSYWQLEKKIEDYLFVSLDGNFQGKYKKIKNHAYCEVHPFKTEYRGHDFVFENEISFPVIISSRKLNFNNARKINWNPSFIKMSKKKKLFYSEKMNAWVKNLNKKGYVRKSIFDSIYNRANICSLSKYKQLTVVRCGYKQPHNMPEISAYFLFDDKDKFLKHFELTAGGNTTAFDPVFSFDLDGISYDVVLVANGSSRLPVLIYKVGDDYYFRFVRQLSG